MTKFWDDKLAEFDAVELDKNRPLRRIGSKPFILSTGEFKVGIVGHVKENLPELLAGQVQKALNDMGHTILWTPSNTRELWPIELFGVCPKIMLLLMPLLISQ